MPCGFPTVPAQPWDGVPSSRRVSAPLCKTAVATPREPRPARQNPSDSKAALPTAARRRSAVGAWELSAKLTEGLYSHAMRFPDSTCIAVGRDAHIPPRLGSLVQRELSAKLTEGLYSHAMRFPDSPCAAVGRGALIPPRLGSLV